VKLHLRTLDRKLLRDLLRMKMQLAAVGGVLACGIVLWVMANGMYDSLQRARDHYYDQERMADMAARVVRAPLQIADNLRAIPGVRDLEARVSGVGLLDLPDRHEPVSALMVSLLPDRQPRVNRIVLRSGRMPDSTRPGEVLVNEAFATANDIRVGSTLGAIIYGKRREVRIAGIASSPEFVFTVAPGAMLPEPKRFGVVWMDRESLARAFDRDGAFNEVIMQLEPGANFQAVAAQVDRQLARYGGRGAYGRDRMISAQFMADELTSLKTMASILPPFFLVVAAFLLNVSLSRLVTTERSNIGLLKSFGYSNRSIALHYAKFALVFGCVGALVGMLGGRLVGNYVGGVYATVYQIPNLHFAAGPSVYLSALAIALLAALAGAAQAVVRATQLAPAAALAPPAPTAFGRLGAAAEKLAAKLDGKSRMVARRILRFPRRSATTITGIALAMGLMVTTQHFPLAMNRIIEVTFELAQREDVMVSFSEAADERILEEISRMPGVLKVEPVRSTDVVFEFGSRAWRNALQGVPAAVALNRTLDENLEPVYPRPDGLTLSLNLANKLGVAPGDRVRVQATDGQRVSAMLPVVAIVKPYLAGSAYLEMDALSRLLREPGRVTSAYLLFDARYRQAFSARAKELPRIVAVSFKDNARDSMTQLLNQGSGFFSWLFVLFSSLMAAGVAFSAARVTLAEQERDLATLRVLGFGRREASYVLVAELGALLLVALPIGAAIGLVMSRWLMSQFETDLFTFPYVTNAGAFARPALFVIAAVLMATLLVRRGVDRLDLVGVLKSRD
jgi:putative ABC transport system permease protein